MGSLAVTALPAARRDRPRRRTLQAGLGLGVLGVSIGAVAVVAVVGGLVTDTDPGSWYSMLVQPSWNPPDWLFAPVWSALYLAMATAAWLAWRAGGRSRALTPYAVQLTLNLAWTVVFFGLESPWGAFVVIEALLLAVLVTAFRFGRRSRPAALLLVPYLAWLGYAAALNLAIALAN